jgi:Leucine-rich repeat (LRR) protein
MIQSIIGTSFKSTSPFNFDITANWSLTTPAVVDEASFKSFLESGEDGDGNTNNLTDVVITDFLLVGNTLTCNLTANGSDFYLAYTEVSVVNSIGNIIGLQYLYLYGNLMVTFNPLIALPNSLESLRLEYNQILTFDPSIALPNSLLELSLNSNQIVTFDPSVTLPNSLENLNLEGNQIVTFNPSIPLPNSLLELNLVGNNIVTFDPSIALPNSLTSLFLFYNQIVIFNPSIALPNSLLDLSLSDNQMTTAGYVASEPWANAMSVIPGRGEISLSNNVNSALVTNLRTILIAKGWNVSA